MRYFTLFLSMAVVGIGCENTADIEGDAPGECSDRADNDQDGDYDCNDSDCAGSPDCQSADDSGDTGEDIDNDGYTESEGDCDDDNPNINPIVVDLVGDGIDQNCDGVDGMDFDGDGAGAVYDFTWVGLILRRVGPVQERAIRVYALLYNCLPSIGAVAVWRVFVSL